VKEANRLRETINEFLTFAHPQPYYFTAVDIAKVIEEVLILARRDSLCGPEVTFQVDIPHDLPPVQIDRDRVQQVLWNLIRNSLEAIKGKGTISLSAGLEASEEALGVAIQISDDGLGIPPEDRELIFEPFFTRKARGSGLGLALVHSAVSAHSGFISLLDNNDDRGCRFHIWLPLTQDNPVTKPKAIR
jgi:signal transduction histidine kinase